jgi:hypothetical protein
MNSLNPDCECPEEDDEIKLVGKDQTEDDQQQIHETRKQGYPVLGHRLLEAVWRLVTDTCDVIQQLFLDTNLDADVA